VVRRLVSDERVRGATFSPDGSRVAVRDRSRSVRLFETASGRRVATLSQKAGITSLAFSGDSRLIVTGSRDGTAEVWSARTGASQVGLLGHTSQVLTVAFCPGGNLVATGSVDGTARVWSTKGRLIDVVRGAQASVTSVAFAPDCALRRGQPTTSASYTLAV